MQRARGGEERCSGKPTRYIRRLLQRNPRYFNHFLDITLPGFCHVKSRVFFFPEIDSHRFFLVTPPRGRPPGNRSRGDRSLARRDRHLVGLKKDVQHPFDELQLEKPVF